ncbi:MAG: hypothetical protein ACREEQ_11030 [Caulobacteraceae bacterium]
MALASLTLALLALGACADNSPGPSHAWYEQGNVSYDSLKAADAACKAKGGVFQLRNGGDPTYLGDFECKNAGKGR